MKKILSLLLLGIMVLNVMFTSIPAKAAPKINKTKVTLYVGDTYKLKVTGTSKTIKWTSSKKTVATVTKKGKVTAKTTGTTTITAKVGKKKLKCKITVKTKTPGKGTKANPKAAFEKTTFSYYEEGKKKGKFSIQLLDFKYGEEANELVTSNSANPIPKKNQEYIYFLFEFNYISGSQTIEAKDIFNYYYNVYNYDSTVQLANLDWGFYFESINDLGQTILSPGNKVTCSKAILVEKGNAPVTFRIQTGKTTYTWFTTEI